MLHFWPNIFHSKAPNVLLRFLFVRNHQRTYAFITQPLGVGGIGFSIDDTDTIQILLVSFDT